MSDFRIAKRRLEHLIFQYLDDYMVLDKENWRANMKNWKMKQRNIGNKMSIENVQSKLLTKDFFLFSQHNMEDIYMKEKC